MLRETDEVLQLNTGDFIVGRDVALCWFFARTLQARLIFARVCGRTFDPTEGGIEASSNPKTERF